MNLCIDVGNTTIGVGFFKEEKLFKRLTHTVDTKKTKDEYISVIKRVLEDNNIDSKEITNAIFSSVVPSINEPLIGAIKEVFCVEPLLIAPGVKTGLAIHVDNPNEVGNDLVAVLVGTKEKYSYPCIVADLGTASKVLLSRRPEGTGRPDAGRSFQTFSEKARKPVIFLILTLIVWPLAAPGTNIVYLSNLAMPSPLEPTASIVTVYVLPSSRDTAVLATVVCLFFTGRWAPQAAHLRIRTRSIFSRVVSGRLHSEQMTYSSTYDLMWESIWSLVKRPWKTALPPSIFPAVPSSLVRYFMTWSGSRRSVSVIFEKFSRTVAFPSEKRRDSGTMKRSSDVSSSGSSAIALFSNFSYALSI